jgi:hypothetical protein
MGYEIKLFIGKDTGRKEDDIDYSTTPPRDSGKKRTYFMTYAMIDLCKLSYDGSFHAAMNNWKNQDKEHFWFKYADDGETMISEDRYDEQWIPQKLSVVLDTLKAEPDAKEYRRLRWAIALLESMADDSESLSVWIYGY